MQVPMKVQRVFAFLGLGWVTEIVVNLISPRTILGWHAYCENLVIHLGRTIHGNNDSLVWVVAFFVVPVCLILLVIFAGIGLQSVIARVIRKARA